MTVKGADRRSQAACWLALMGILWLGTALRMHALGATSLWTDEINVVLAARGSLPEVLQGARSHFSAPPLDYFVVHLLATGVGSQEFVLRFGAVAWSVLSIPLAYRLGRQAAGRWAGVATALLLATSPLHVGFSRQVKFYAALTFFSLLSNVVFVYALRYARRPRRWRPWLAHGLANVAGIYFHPYVALILLCQGAYLGSLWLGRLVANRLRRTPLPAGALPFLLSAALTTACFAPWFFWDMAQQSAAGAYSTATDLAWLADALEALGHEHAWSAAILGSLVLCSLLPTGQRRRPDVRPLLALNVLVIGLVVWTDNVAGYWFAPKQMLFALPAYLALAAAGLASLYRLIHRLVSRFPAGGGRLARWLPLALVVAAIVGASIPAVARIAGTWDREKQNWRAAAALLEQEAQAGDGIAGLDRAAHSVAYYGPNLPIERLADKRPAGLAQLLAEHPRLWYVRDLDFGRQQPALEQWIQDQGFTTTDVGGVLVSVGDRAAASAEGEQQPAVEGAGEDASVAKAALERGQSYYAENRWQEALAEFQQVTALKPEWGIGHTKLGNTYRQLGRLEEAEAAYRLSIAAEPGYVGAYVQLGDLYRAQGREDESLAPYREAVEADPASAWAHNALGSALLAGGHTSEALAYLERAVELEPENVTWLLALADAQCSLGQEEQAVTLYRQVLALEPGNRRATEALEALEP